MKVANQDSNLEEFAEWMEDTIECYELLLRNPDEFFLISGSNVSDANTGTFIIFIFLSVLNT
jgi:hypothetical protein